MSRRSDVVFWKYTYQLLFFRADLLQTCGTFESRTETRSVKRTDSEPPSPQNQNQDETFRSITKTSPPNETPQ